MIELVDNLIQLAAVLSGFAVSGVFYLKSRRQPYFLLCCFYGCFGSALLYWLLYTVLVARAPSVFYVSDIGWISSFLFLLLLQYSLAGTEERTSRSRLPWLALLIRNTVDSVLYQPGRCTLQSDRRCADDCHTLACDTGDRVGEKAIGAGQGGFLRCDSRLHPAGERSVDLRISVEGRHTGQSLLLV